MTAERVTVSLPHDLVACARSAVSSGAADSLSAFVADALRSKLEKTRALADLEQVLGGPPPREALEAVRRTLGLRPLAAEQRSS